MVSKNDLIAALPPFRNEKDLIIYDQSTADIIREIIDTHKMYETDYDHIYQFFETGYVPDDCYLIWSFLRTAMPYTIESEQMQTVKSPAAILQKGEEIDCKHYSLFTGGILDAINAANGGLFDWCYRFAGYKSRAIEHVFVVLAPNTNDELWIDPVLDIFDYRLQPKYYIDKRL